MKTISIWLMAIRPKTLTVALVPIIVATAHAATIGSISLSISLFAFISAFCIQIGTNLMNDALDFKKGADTSRRLGPVRAAQSGLLSQKQLFQAGWLAFALALLFGIPLIIEGGLPIATLLVISVICGYCYTGGPFPIAYHGLGELFVFLFFGLASTMAVFYLQTGFITLSSFLAGSQIGLFATLVLAINNLRDIDEDRRANKRTLTVRFGKDFGRAEIAFLALSPFVLNLLWFFYGFPAVAIIPLITLPLAIYIIRKIRITEPSPLYNKYFGLSALLHLGFGLVFAVTI